MRPFNGCVDQMFGPNHYGYVDAGSFVLGEKGGRYLIAHAVLVQQPKDQDGNPRFPVWSDDLDRIVVACPPSVRVKTVQDPKAHEDWLVWVDRIDRDPSRYRHDLHPMDPRCAMMDMDWTTAECMVFDSIAKPAREDAKTSNFMSFPPYGFGGQILQSLPNTLVAAGKIERTTDGRYRVVPGT